MSRISTNMKTPRLHKSAQRLTASEVCPDFAWGDTFDRGEPVCSTPYGIRGVSRFNPKSQLAHNCVLNALRHQRCVQAVYLPPNSYVCSVLNALRHQRCVQRQILRFGKAPSWCSTPYGIRGVSREPVRPLNRCTVSCSTPYGIKGVDRNIQKCWVSPFL